MRIDTRYVHGGLRALVTLGAAAALVQGVQSAGWGLDLTSTGAVGAAPARALVSDVTLTCAGPEMAGIKGVLDRQLTMPVVAAAAPAEALGAAAPSGPGSLTIAPLATQNPATNSKSVSTGVLSGVDSGAVRGTGSLAPGIAASQELLNGTPTLRGLTSAPCGQPSADTWLVAGGGQPGRQERLILSNPGANQVTANVSIFGAGGPVRSATGQGVVVPARGRVAVLLDAIASSEARPVVHITATGGSLRATLNDSWLDGSVAAGVDDTVPTAAPATSLVIPGVAVVDGAVGSASVRILAPGASSAVVQLRLLTVSGGAPLPTGAVQTVKAGTVVDVPLTGLRPDTYAIQVTSDVPVVAAATFARRAARAPGDFAWMPASPTIEGVAGMAVIPTQGRARSVLLAATGDSVTADLTQVASDGKVTKSSVTISADSIKNFDVPGASVWVRQTGGAGQLRAGILTYFGAGAAQMITAMPLSDTQVDATLSRILPVP